MIGLWVVLLIFISCNIYNFDDSGNAITQGCTYKLFLDCKPKNFNGTEGAVGFIRWVEKTESVIRISKCTPEQMVMYATCLFLDEALTWWNLQVQTLGSDAAYGRRGKN